MGGVGGKDEGRRLKVEGGRLVDGWGERKSAFDHKGTKARRLEG